MGLKLDRNKPRSLLLSFTYRLTRLKILSVKQRLKLYSELEWIFNRLTHEESFRYYKNEEHPIRKGTMNFIVKYLDMKFNVIDIGTNEGDLSFLILPYVNTITGIDHNPELISRANQKYGHCPSLTFVQQDANSFLKNNNEEFDVLILSHILEHIDNPSSFIEEIKHYFKFIYIELPDIEYSNSNQYRVDTGSKLIYSDTDHVSEFDRKELTEILEKSNLEIIGCEYKHAVQRYWCKVQKTP